MRSETGNRKALICVCLVLTVLCHCLNILKHVTERNMPGGFSSASGLRAYVRACRQVELNTASAMRLRSLPGIGRCLSERVVSARKELGGFRSKDELLDIKGIGPYIYGNIKGFLVLERGQDGKKTGP